MATMTATEMQAPAIRVHGDSTPTPKLDHYHSQQARRRLMEAVEQVRAGHPDGAGFAYHRGFVEDRPRVVDLLSELGFDATGSDPEGIFRQAVARMIAGSPVSFPDPLRTADRLGYQDGYAGRDSPQPTGDHPQDGTFRARCVGWVRGYNDRPDGKPAQFPEEEYRPTHREPIRVSRLMEIEWAGFCVGANGGQGVGPAHYSAEELAAFMRGHEAGFRAYEEAEHERAAMDPSGPVEVHHAELIEAGGVDFARHYR